MVDSGGTPTSSIALVPQAMLGHVGRAAVLPDIADRSNIGLVAENDSRSSIPCLWCCRVHVSHASGASFATCCSTRFWNEW